MKKIVISLIISVSVVGCTLKQHPALTPRPNTWANKIDHETNLYQIDEQLYRSEQLSIENLSTLKQHHIDTLINLRYFDRDDDKENFSQQKNFTLINEPLMAWSIKPEQLAKILYHIENQQKLGKKVLVHCYHGADRTGIVIAMYRIIQQNWSIEEAKQEMMQGGYGYHVIWKNIEKLLTQEKVTEVKQQLQRLKNTS